MSDGATVEDAINNLLVNGIGEGGSSGNQDQSSVAPIPNTVVKRDDLGQIHANAFIDENNMIWVTPTSSIDTLESADRVIQEYIDDIDEIRIGAALGKTALQSETYKGTITSIKANGTSVATSGEANIPAASTSVYGVTKLSTSTNSTSTTLAATASAVRSAYNLANGKYTKPSGGIPVSDLDAVTQTAINNAVTRDTFGELELIQIQGFEGSLSGMLYALPSEATGDEDDIILTKNHVKTINGQSIYGSGNINVSGGSGGSGNGAYAQVNHGTGDTTFTLTPNTFHIWDEVGSLDLDLGSETGGVANEYIFQFTSGSEPTSLSLPEDVKWVGDNTPTINENKIYQISILNNLAVCLEFDNAPQVELITFTINYGGGSEVDTLIAENGMTWEVYCHSPYNIEGEESGGILEVDSNVMNSENGGTVCLVNGEAISSTDLIIPNYEYIAN